MLLAIQVALLLFALGSSKHTLSRMQIANGSDIYQIREKPNNMVKIIEPKPKIPTLREIIYFKIKEKPYINNIKKEKPPQEPGPDFDDSKRTITDGPGFEFPNFEPVDDRSTKLLRRKRESNYNVKKNMVSQDDRGESNLQDVKRPATYGFHLNYGKGFVWNHLPFIYQENNINDPSNIVNKENNEEYKTDNSPESSSEASNSESDDNSLYSENDSGYNAEPKNEEEEDQSSDETPITSANRLDQDNQEKRKNSLCTVTNNFNQCNMEPTCADKCATKTKESTNSPLQKDTKTTPVVPECSIQNQSHKPSQFNNLSEPSTESLNKDQDNPQEWKKPSSIASNNFNQSNMEPTCADKCATKTKESTNSPLQKDTETTPVVPEYLIQNQSQKPTKFNHLNEPDKENLNTRKDKDNSDSKKDNEPSEVVLDKIIEKDEFQKWLKKWTTPYARVLKEHVAELVNKEIAKHINETMNHQNVKKPTKYNNLSEPSTESLNKDQDNLQERKKPSSIANNNFNQSNMEPTSADKCATKTKESTNSPLQKDKETTPVVPEYSIQNQSQKPTKFNHLNEPDKESLNTRKDKDNSDNKKDNEPSELVLDKIIKKDEFRKWFKKWTTPYVRVLKEHVVELVNKEVAKHVNKTMNHQNVREKDKIDTNKNTDTAAPVDTTANKTGSADTAANKPAPTDTAASKTAPEDTVASKTAPADTAFTKTALADTTDNKTASADSAANKTAPADTAANKTAPANMMVNKK